MIRRILLFSLIFILVLPFRGQGQDEYARFKRISINDGLSLNSVYRICQDSKGFMWFGTEDGLNRYDGQNITVFGATTSRHQIMANKWIEEIYEDKAGMIWLGSRGGLTMYNPRKGQFSVIRHNPLDPLSLSNDTVTRIIANLRNEIWVGTYRGLNRVDRYTGEVERIIPDENDLLGLMSRINDLEVDRSGILWIASEEGLFSNDGKSGLFFHEEAEGLLGMNESVCCIDLGSSNLWLGTESGLVQFDLSGQGNHFRIPVPSGAPIRKLMEDHLGQVWILTRDQLLLFRNMDEGMIPLLNTNASIHSLALNPVESLVETQNQHIWFGTFGDGAFRFDPESLEYEHFLHNSADPTSLSDNSINCIYEDRTGAVWFGTYGLGISILDPMANKFTLLKHNPFNPNSMASSFIWTVMESSDKVIWMGTDERGISCLDQSTGRFTHYEHDPSNPTSLSNNSVRKIYQDSKDRIWIGTDGGGLNLYLPGQNKFKKYLHDPDDPSSISHNSVRAIYEDPRGRLWVGTRGGLNLMDPQKGTFRRYLHDPDDPNSLGHNFVYSAIHMDKEGKLWIGTYGGGLSLMDPETGFCENFRHDYEDPTSLSDNIVFAIYEDPMGRFWIGTNSGLSMFYPATGSFRRFGLDEGLPNEVIYGILPDGHNHIWLSTNLGVVRFNLDSFEVRNFDMNDGLQSNEFNGGAFYGSPEGRLFFGGVYGLNIINPDQLIATSQVPEVTLTKLEVLGKEVRIADATLDESFADNPLNVIESGGEYYSRESFTYMDELVLDYRHRFFSIEFATFNHTGAEDLQYSYIMENLDAEWIEAGSRNYVSYANMKPGTYNFRVLARNNDGFESHAPASLLITITPPFWLRWWFVLIEILFATAVVVMIYNYLVKTRTNRLLKYQNQQIIEANEALRESERNLMELNATKDKFFSIISHDLKNPFSSLLSISELLVENFDATDKEDHKDGFRKMNQSLKHLLDLLENLLTWSRSQRGKIKYDPVRFNLSNLIQENINIHKLPAERKGIILQAPKRDDVHAFGDRDMVNAVIRNLMTNAVKFTDRQGKIEIDLSTHEDSVRVSVVDEGTGIAKADLNRLFRIDQKFKSNGTAGEKGTGLGLIICREFVEKHGGHMDVESTPGRGSTFSFTLPLSN